MKLNDILTATCLVPLVASQLLGGDTYQTKNTTIDLNKVTLSNEADCGKATGDFDNLYKDFKLYGVTIVNTTQTANCRSPVGSTPLRGLSGDNIIYGDNNFALFAFNSVRPSPNTLFSGPTAFDVSFDVDSLKYGDNSGISLQLVWNFRTVYVADETITFNAKSNGQPPYRVNVNKTAITADSISVEAYILDNGSISSPNLKLGIFNIDFGVFVKDVDENKTTSSTPSSRQTATSTASSSSRRTSASSTRPITSTSATSTTATSTGAKSTAATSTEVVPASSTTANAGVRQAPSFNGPFVLAALYIFW